MHQSEMLTAVRSRILLNLLVEGSLYSSCVMRNCRISGTTWKRESSALVSAGLIRYADRRLMNVDGIKRVKFYFLTRRGIQLAKYVQNIVDLMKRDDSMVSDNLAVIAQFFSSLTA